MAMDIFCNNEKIGSLREAKVNGLEIEGLWVNYFGSAEEQKESYTLKDGYVTYHGCWLSHCTGKSNGSHVKFSATNKNVNSDQKPK